MTESRAMEGLLRWTVTVKRMMNQCRLCTAQGQEAPETGPVRLQKYANFRGFLLMKAKLLLASARLLLSESF